MEKLTEEQVKQYEEYLQNKVERYPSYLRELFMVSLITQKINIGELLECDEDSSRHEDISSLVEFCRDNPSIKIVE